MLQHNSAGSFAHDGDRVGVVVCHGFTSTVHSVEPLARALAQAGHSVRAPLLPGHGTMWRDLARTRWPQWLEAVRHAADSLSDRCDTVIVAGQSLGGALALRLAQVHPDRVSGLVLINPALTLEDPRLRALPLLKRVLPAVGGVGGDIAKSGVDEVCYPRVPLRALDSMLDLQALVRADLRSVRCRVLLALSGTDHVVPASSGQAVRAGISQELLEVLPLPRSFHVATLDHDADLLTQRTLAFVADLAGRTC